MSPNDMYDLTSQNGLKLKAVAKFYHEFSNAKDLIKICKENELVSNNLCVIGEGTNSIFPANFNRFVIKPAGNRIQIIENKKNITLKVEAGVKWDDLIDFCCKNNFYGLENLAGIPGSVGAAPVQNIGAYGKELSENILKIEAYDLSDKLIKELNNADCKFNYRESIFKKNKNLIITSVFLNLSNHFSPKLEYKDFKNQVFSQSADLIAFVREIRLKKIPDQTSFPNLGSFFKNPIVDQEAYNCNHKLKPLTQVHALKEKVKLSAAEMIEAVGLKGLRINGCGISVKHSLVLVNTGISSSDDIQRVEKLIKEKVRKAFGINLETEPIYL